MTGNSKNRSKSKKTKKSESFSVDALDSWTVIISDDDEEVHRITRIVLKGYAFQGKELTLLHAHSGEETLKLLKENPDTALILLDVVMETDHAGLEAVQYIRETLNNSIVQIILRTGQPGMAPEHKVIQDYDINNYKSKQELTTQQLHTAITASLRAFSLARSYEELAAQLNIELHERKKVEEKLKKTLEEVKNLSLTDELTGLSNRRGFLTLADQQLKLSRRLDKPIMLFFMDLDGLKVINDNLGHHAGDKALIDTAGILQKTFREADIIGRLGGDEFVVLSVDNSKEHDERIMTRLINHIEYFNQRKDRDFFLSMSIGTAEYEPGENVTINKLMEIADRHMYLVKAQKKACNTYDIIKEKNLSKK